MNEVITNCPNCGAPLDKLGYCSYCNTTVHIDRNLEINSCKSIDINIVMKQGEEFHILPLRGRIDSLEMVFCDAERPEVKFEFCGSIR